MTKTVSPSLAARYKTQTRHWVAEDNDDDMHELALLDGVALIPLRETKRSNLRAYAIIDAEDAAWARQHAWHLNSDGYVDSRENGQPIALHRKLTGCTPGDGMFVDHADRDTLNNCRSNLRRLTPAQNSQNRKVYRNSTSQYRGVIWNRWKQKWQANVTYQGVTHRLGYFDDEHEAGTAAQAKRLELMPFAVD